MQILLTYATNSGSTFLVAETISRIIEKKFPVTMRPAQSVRLAEIAAADLIILGTPSWLVQNLEGQPHEAITRLLDQAEYELTGKRLAVFGCGDSGFVNFCGAITIVEERLKKLKGRLILPSLKIDRYFFAIAAGEEAAVAWARQLLAALESLLF